MTSRAALLSLLIMASVTTPAMAQDVPSSDFNPPPQKLTARTRHFTVVASFETERGAMRRLNELRERGMPVDAVVFPPAGRRGKYWTVVVASFTDFNSATQLARGAATTSAALDAYVIGMKAAQWGNEQFAVLPASVELRDSAGLVSQGPPPTVLQDANLLVLLSRHTAFVEAEGAAAKLLAQFHDLELSVLKAPDSTYGVALATFVSRPDAERALETAARMGLQVLEPISLAAGSSPGWSVPIELTDRRAEIARRVKACYSGRDPSKPASEPPSKTPQTSIKALQACSGEWLTPPLLTKCILESDCLGLAEADVDSVLNRLSLNRDSQIKLSIAGAPFGGDVAEIQRAFADCRAEAKNDSTAFTACASKRAAGPQAAAAVDCLSAAKTEQESAACVAKASGVAPEQIECLSRANGDAATALKCVGSTQDTELATRLANCASTTGNEADYVRRCVLPSVPDDKAEKAACLIAASRSPEKILTCVDKNAPPEARAAAACLASTDGSAPVLARCLARKSGGDVAKVAACLSADSLTPEKVAACAAPDDPNVQRAVRLAACAANYSSTTELLTTCSEGLGIDPKVAKLASCATAGDERQVGACAASQFLPPEAARLAACAAGSQSATGVALCAAAPALSEEWRIAAECAMTSGGVPVTFAACAAGRLTVRELTKCLTGQECFGPNNEVVKAFNTVGNDLTHGLGPTNDLVVATKPVVDGINHVAGEAAKIHNQVTEAARQSPLGRLVCGIFGCG